MKDCKFLPRVAACIDCITQHPAGTKEMLSHHRKMMHPDAKKAAKDSYLKVLQSSCLPEHTDLDDLADQLTNASSWNDGSDNYSVSICHLTHHQNTTSDRVQDQIEGELDAEGLTCMDTLDLLQDIQPVRFPDPHIMRMFPSGLDRIITNVLPSDITQPYHIIGQCARVDTRRDLADTGASVRATGRIENTPSFYTAHTLRNDGIRRYCHQSSWTRNGVCEKPGERGTWGMFFVYIPSVDG
jgi:hypothetical protein